jgi:hypothetical protein
MLRLTITTSLGGLSHMARRLLPVLTAAATLGAVVVTSQAAEASVSPRPAVTALTIEGAAGSYLLGAGSRTYVGADVVVTPAAESVTFGTAAGTWSATLSAPTGGRLAVGTYSTGRFADSGVAGLDLSGEGRGCNAQAGEVVIHEISRDAGTGAISSLAATYSTKCETTMPANVGELRYGSTVDYERFGRLGLGKDSALRTVTVTATDATPFGSASITGQDPTSFRIAKDGCSDTTLAAGASCTVQVFAHPRQVGGHAATLLLPSTAGDRAVGLTTTAVDTPEGTFTPLTPQRVLDTRKAIGVTTRTPIGAARYAEVQVTGKKGVPSSGVSAVVLNVTAIAPTRQGYLTVYPSTMTRPTASSVNFGAGWVGANLVTVPIASGGKVRVYNAAGSTHVAADVVGYYHSATSKADPASRSLNDFGGLEPFRAVDTRTADWGKQPLAGQHYLWQALDFDEYNSRIQAYAVNVTVVKPSKQGHLTAFDGGTTIPSTSTLNFEAGRTVPNMAIIKASPCGADCGAGGEQFPRFGIYNASLGSAHVVVDVVGIYFKGEPGDWAWRFKSLPSPKRFVDSRKGQGLAANLGSNRSATVVTPSSIAGYNTMGIVTNLTAAKPSSTTVLTLWPNNGSTRPVSSNLNPYAGQVVSNMTMTIVGGKNDFRVHNLTGTAPVIIDAAGTMEYYPALVPGDPMDAAAAAGVAKAEGSSTDRLAAASGLHPRSAGHDRVDAR